MAIQLLDAIAVRIPRRLRILPAPAVRIIACLVAVNVAIWAAVAIVLRYHPLLASSTILSYTLGLRHAMDADHISAIDLMTRRLVASGSKPVTVGMWFSLGHSTIVFITCIVVAATSGALENKFGGFEKVGGIIGTAVSAAVLLLLGIGNAWILFKLVQQIRLVIKEELPEDRHHATSNVDFGLEGAGLLVRLFKKLFHLIDRPWKMYPLGVLFGLGFDTSSEIAVLGIASLQGAQGTSIWLILIFPILFTAGMCLIDTTDGALMMSLYTSTSLARDTIAILYYSIVLSAITVLVATFIGILQLLSLVTSVANPAGSFWDGVNDLSDHFDIIGGAICGAFVVFGAASVLIYGPWRRRIDRRCAMGAVEMVDLETLEDGKIYESKDSEVDKDPRVMSFDT